MVPPPVMIRGDFARIISRTTSATTDGSGTGRRTRQTRRSKNRSGQSNASPWTSSGSDTVTAPVSTGSVSTRKASGRLAIN